VAAGLSVSAGFLLFDHEDEAIMLLWDIWLSRRYTALQLNRLYTLHSHCSKNLRTNKTKIRWLNLKGYFCDSGMDSCFMYKASAVGELSLAYLFTFTQKIEGCFTLLIIEAYCSLYLSLSMLNFVYLESIIKYRYQLPSSRIFKNCLTYLCS
jgi:hypothetical protein